MAIADEFADVFKSVTKDLHTEKKRRERDARTAVRRAPQPSRITQREAVFDVMKEAVAHVSGGGALPYPVRNLFYAVRPLMQRFTDDELNYGYFSQDLVIQYQRMTSSCTTRPRRGGGESPGCPTAGCGLSPGPCT